MRTRPCPEDVLRGRLAKDNEFAEAADLMRDRAADLSDLRDAYVTLCLHAGIAASDVICCRHLGRHAVGESHADGPQLARALSALLNLKTRIGNSHRRASAATEVQRWRADAAARQRAALP